MATSKKTYFYLGYKIEYDASDGMWCYYQPWGDDYYSYCGQADTLAKCKWLCKRRGHA